MLKLKIIDGGLDQFEAEGEDAATIISLLKEWQARQDIIRRESAELMKEQGVANQIAGRTIPFPRG